MTTHLPIRAANAYACPACGWRGVMTTRGLITTARGDERADHTAGILARQQELMHEAQRIKDHLRAQHRAGLLSLGKTRAFFRLIESEFGV